MAKAAAREKTVGLSDLVIALRDEIDKMQAHLEASGEPGILKIDKAEIEISFGVERSTAAGGGVSFKVFGIGFEGKGDQSWKDAVTQKMVLTLSPLDPLDPVGVAEE